jgi:DNA-binding NtrC family response regulator
LLRFLETGEFRRVGGTVNKTVNVRVISASNKNLQEEVQAGRFREDLLYRLNVVSIRLPDLKERKDDIPLLVEAFLSRKTRAKRLSKESMAVLMRYNWPGNVRELEHAIEGAVAVSQSEEIQPKDLWMNVALNASSSAAVSVMESDTDKLLSLEELEKAYIEKILRHHHWNRTNTAATLGITTKTLYLKIKRYKIKLPKLDIE